MNFKFGKYALTSTVTVSATPTPTNYPKSGVLHAWAPAELCVYPGKTWLLVAFDVQRRKAYFVTALYALRTSVHTYAICW